MKRHRYLPALPAAALVLAAAAGCGGTGSSEHGGNIDHPAGASSPASMAPSASAPARHLSAQDRTWLTFIHQVNLAEVTAGELAQKKGGTAAVRSAGKMLTTDHEALDAKVTKVAGGLGVSLPGSAPPDQEALAKKLENESGKRFDQDFLSNMITGHQQAIAKTQAEVGQGSAPEVKNLAQMALPDLKKHLSTLQKAQHSG